MRILWAATKTPAPPVDGGRLVALLTLEALKAHGHELTIVSPIDPDARDHAAIAARLERIGRVVLVPARPEPLAVAALRTAFGPTPITVRRHALSPVRDAVTALLSRETFDVVHAEQPQALAQVEEARRRGVPVVLRAQNVESDLWHGASRTAGFLRPILAREARRLADHEGRAVRETAATVALTTQDAARLVELSGAADRVHHVPAPFPAQLPPGSRPLAGAPAVVLFGSAGWRPHAEGVRWFLRDVWPRVRAVLPGAALHVAGAAIAASDGVVGHPAPADSREAFAAGSVLVVPLHVASGVRMRILEAWARGVPVVATPAGAHGLDATDGRELLLARDAEEFALALRRLHTESAVVELLTTSGRQRLAAHHDPHAVAARLSDVYALR